MARSIGRGLLVVAAVIIAGAMAMPGAAQDGGWRQHEMARPQPPVVAPAPQALPTPPPADAVILFDGHGLDAWRSVKGGDAAWRVDGDAFVVAPGSGAIETKAGFGDLQLHVEWSAPTEIVGQSQGRGNSGVFLMQRYEIQVLDAWQNDTYADGQAGAIYGQYPPLANSIRPPGEWNAYDIFFRAPRFGAAGQLITAARATVLANGILMQNNEELWGATNWLQASPYAAHPPALPIMLQDHGNPVRFRNIWARPIPERPTAPPREAIAAMAMPREQLDLYVGRYERAPGQYISIRRAGDQLLANVLGDDLGLVVVSPTELAFIRTDARLRFELDASGRPPRLVMNLGGVDYPAGRVESDRAQK